MTFSSYLTNLIIPFNLCMTLVVIGLVLGLFRLRKTGGALIVAGLLWALAWSLPVTSVWLGGALESRYPHLSPEQSPTADAIVVLGGNTANGRANWFLPYEKDKAVVRIDIAAQLWPAARPRCCCRAARWKATSAKPAAWPTPSASRACRKRR